MDDLRQQDEVTERELQADQARTAEPERPSELEEWQIATEALREMLDTSDGIVSSRALRPELERRGVVSATKMVTKLKLFNSDDPKTELTAPFRYYHIGRSFYSEQAYAEAQAEINTAAEKAEREVEVEEQYEEYEEEEVHTKRKNQQEEARLCKYVQQALESLYVSDYGPEDVQIAYDIHNERPGSEFENMDVIAIHWRSDEVVELVGVEVKLSFSPRLVLQAGNYKRFAHRVWVAVPVSSYEPGVELREYDALLFEHVIEEGIGVLACRKKQGGAYEVWPIHWPRLNLLDSLARDAFIERYRSVFEEANVVEPDAETWHPRLR